MKHLLLSLSALLVSAFSFAQCTSCTINITGNDPADHVLSIGQTLCVQAGGTATGRILVSSGGKVCNQGHIHTTNILVTAGGELDNYGMIMADSLLVSGASAVLHNSGSITDDRLAVTSGGALDNTGDITFNIFGDSTCTVTNQGSFTANQDLAQGYGASFNNTGRISVGRDFYNSAGATFTTSCMVSIQRDWYNTGTIDGPGSGCGGFNITGQSLNTGTIGGSGHVDICDAGHPVLGLDGNTGTTTGVTFCQCSSACTALGIGEVPENISFDPYPNPATNSLHLSIPDGAISVTLTDMIGQSILSQSVNGRKQIDLSTTALSTGMYVVTVQGTSSRASRLVEIQH
ncbi:MAG: T9SS type A sorting domain-containing protein [Bacteroidetes bacterium]|nr:T9SS type A sorting domain-containing protein [Bacteroidota bacterium]